jgi:uncharacterized protein YcbX
LSPLGTVAVCARYPVKSVLGEQLDQLWLDRAGPVGDRIWGLRTADGRLGSGKNSRRFVRLDRMLEMSARTTRTDVILRLPDGEELAMTDPTLVEALAEVVGRTVAVDRADGQPHHDGAPLHLVTTASLRWWADQAPEHEVGWQRTRANVVVDVRGSDRVEDNWVGRRLRIGDADVDIVEPTERCAMVTHAQAELEHAAALLRVLAPHDLNLGVYATVVTPGTVRVGDPVVAL